MSGVFNFSILSKQQAWPCFQMHCKDCNSEKNKVSIKDGICTEECFVDLLFYQLSDVSSCLIFDKQLNIASGSIDKIGGKILNLFDYICLLTKRKIAFLDNESSLRQYKNYCSFDINADNFLLFARGYGYYNGHGWMLSFKDSFSKNPKEMKSNEILRIENIQLYRDYMLAKILNYRNYKIDFLLDLLNNSHYEFDIYQYLLSIGEPDPEPDNELVRQFNKIEQEPFKNTRLNLSTDFKKIDNISYPELDIRHRNCNFISKVLNQMDNSKNSITKFELTRSGEMIKLYDPVNKTLSTLVKDENGSPKFEMMPYKIIF